MKQTSTPNTTIGIAMFVAALLASLALLLISNRALS
jgi:hypothetical protein